MNKRPLIGVGAVVFGASGEILLIKRGKPPHYGRWMVPGGTLEWGETLEEAVLREVREETGIDIEIEHRQGRSFLLLLAKVALLCGRWPRFEKTGQPALCGGGVDHRVSCGTSTRWARAREVDELRPSDAVTSANSSGLMGVGTAK